MRGCWGDSMPGQGTTRELCLVAGALRVSGGCSRRRKDSTSPRQADGVNLGRVDGANRRREDAINSRRVDGTNLGREDGSSPR